MHVMQRVNDCCCARRKKKHTQHTHTFPSITYCVTQQRGSNSNERVHIFFSLLLTRVQRNSYYQRTGRIIIVWDAFLLISFLLSFSLPIPLSHSFSHFFQCDDTQHMHTMCAQQHASIGENTHTAYSSCCRLNMC